jgi:hypothetical protein
MKSLQEQIDDMREKLAHLEAREKFYRLIQNPTEYSKLLACREEAIAQAVAYRDNLIELRSKTEQTLDEIGRDQTVAQATLKSLRSQALARTSTKKESPAKVSVPKTLSEIAERLSKRLGLAKDEVLQALRKDQ